MNILLSFLCLLAFLIGVNTAGSKVKLDKSSPTYVIIAVCTNVLAGVIYICSSLIGLILIWS